MSRIARFVFALTGALTIICAAAPLAAQSYCSSSSTNMNYEWISRVEINGVERTSGKEGFNDQSGTSLTTLAIGSSYPVEVDVSTGGGPWLEYVKIWFDLNHDGAFADPRELIFNESQTVPADSTATFFANIAIPACALPGPTRLRVIMQYAANPSLCGTYTYGETEDYMVTITGSEAAPTSADSSFTIDEDSTHTFNTSSFAFNDTDPGQTLSNVVIASLPTSGTLKLNGSAVTAGQAISTSDISTGRLVFQPPANTSGTPLGSFTFRVTDCVDKQSATYTMTANVSSVPDNPTISAIGNQTMNENTTLGPLAFTVNDVDTGAESVTVSVASSNTTVAPLSSLQLGGSGASRTLTITPPANKFGTANITLTASDGSLTATTSFVLTVNGVNDAPVLAVNTGVTIAPAATVTITSSELQVTDVDNTPSEIEYTLTIPPSHGTLYGGTSFTQSDIDAGSISYVNDGAGATTDSFRFTVSDGSGGSIATQTFTILVQPWISIADLSVTETDSSSTANPMVTLSGTWASPIGISWTTSDGSAIAGTDYEAGSGTVSVAAGSTHASIPITILGDNVMKLSRSLQVTLSAPTAGRLKDDTATITIDDDDPMPTLSISGGSDREGNSSTSNASFVVSLSEPSGLDVTFDYATVSGSATSPVDFTAASGSGTISAGALTTSINITVSGDYEVEDDEVFSLQLSNVARATVSASSATWTIVSDDHAPVADDDTASLDEDETLVVAAPGLLANDSDGDGDTLAASIVTHPAHGVLSASDDGSFSYKPDSDYFGDDSFTYRVSDGHFESNIATVSLTIHSVNDSPVAEDDTSTTSEDTTLTIPVSTLVGNDSDVEDDNLTVVSVANPSAEGGLVDLADGSITYRPASDFGGIDSFLYTISDGNGGTASASVIVDVTRLVNVGVSIAGPSEMTPGTESSWTVTVSNAGPSDAEGLTLLVPTPAGLTLTGSPCSPCAEMELAEGATTSFLMKAAVPSSWTSSGTFTIEASVSSTTTEMELGDNADSLEVTVTNPVTDLAVSMTAPDTIIPGTTAQFVITVSNSGPSDVSAANLEIALPDSFVESSRVSSSGEAAINGWSLVAGSSISWTIDGTIDPNARGSASTTARVATLEPASDPDSSNDSAARTASLEPRVRLVPAITHDREPAVLDRGVGWTLTVTNEGPSTATGLTFDLTATDLELTSPDNGSLGSLQPGETSTVSIDSTATALPRAVLSAVIATVESANDDATASDEVSVRSPLADLEISITTLVSSTRVGERFPIEILVTNNGPEEAVDAVVSLEGETRSQLLSMSVVDSLISSSRRVELGTIQRGGTIVLTGEALTREAGRVEIKILATSGWDDPDPDSAHATLLVDADPTSYSTILPFAEDGIDASGSRRRTVVTLGNLGFMTSRIELRQTRANGSEAASDMNWLAAGESRSIDAPLARRSAAYSSGWIIASAEDVSKIGAFHSTAWIETTSRGAETYCPVRPGTVLGSDVWLHGLVEDSISRAIVAIVNTDTVRPLELDVEIYPADGSGGDARTFRVSIGPGQLTTIEPLHQAGLGAASVRIHPRIPVPNDAAFLAWAMTEDRVSGDRGWRSPIVDLTDTGDRIVAIPPAGRDTIVLTITNPTSDPLRVRLTLDGDVERELSLRAREARTVDLSDIAAEDRYGILRVTFFDGAGARSGLAWATSRRPADGGGWLFDETPMPLVSEAISTGTMHPGRLKSDRTARVLVVNSDDDVAHVTLSLLDTNDGSVIRTLTSLVDGRSVSVLPDVSSYLTDRPGYLQIETSGGERIFTELLVEPLDEYRGSIDTLHVPVISNE